MDKPVAPLLFGKRRPVPSVLTRLLSGTDSERDLKAPSQTTVYSGTESERDVK